MSSKITTVMSVRVKNETADYFRDKPLNKVVESVHHLAKKNEIEIRENGDVVVRSSDDEWKDGGV